MLAACTTAPVDQPTTQDDTSDAQDAVAPSTDLEPIEITQTDITSLSISNIEYIFADTPNQYGDSSAMRKNPGVFVYDTTLDITYNLVLPVQLKNRPIYMKILGKKTSGEVDDLVYEGMAKDGGDAISFSTGLQHASDSPRMTVCFSTIEDFDPLKENYLVACTQLLGDAPNVGIDIRENDFPLDFELPDDVAEGDVLTASGELAMVNTGTTPVTVFAALDKVSVDKDYEVTFEPSSLDLAGGQEGKIQVVATWNYDGGFINDAKGYVYMLADNCAPSYECAQTAKERVEFDVNYRN